MLVGEYSCTSRSRCIKRSNPQDEWLVDLLARIPRAQHTTVVVLLVVVQSCRAYPRYVGVRVLVLSLTYILRMPLGMMCMGVVAYP